MNENEYSFLALESVRKASLRNHVRRGEPRQGVGNSKKGEIRPQPFFDQISTKNQKMTLPIGFYVEIGGLKYYALGG